MGPRSKYWRSIDSTLIQSVTMCHSDRGLRSVMVTSADSPGVDYGCDDYDNFWVAIIRLISNLKLKVGSKGAIRLGLAHGPYICAQPGIAAKKYGRKLPAQT